MPPMHRVLILLALLALGLWRPAATQAQQEPTALAPEALRALCQPVRLLAGNANNLVPVVLNTLDEVGWPDDALRVSGRVSGTMREQWARMDLREAQARVAAGQTDGIVFLATALASLPAHPTSADLYAVVVGHVVDFLLVDRAIFEAYQAGARGRAAMGLALISSTDPFSIRWRATLQAPPIPPARRNFWEAWFVRSEDEHRAYVQRWLQACNAAPDS